MAVIDTEGYILRRYKDGDEVKINKLFNEIFNKNRSMEEWSWKFRKNPFHDINLTVVAEYQGEIIGQYPLLPLLFKYDKTVLKCTTAIDNFIHPSFRGGMKGVQRKMYEYHEEICRKEGMSFGFGFPNREHYIFGKRVLKYRDLGQIRVFFRRLNWNLAVKRRFPWIPNSLLKVIQFISGLGFKLLIHSKGRNNPKGIRICEDDSFDERFDAFWDRVKEKYKIIGVRNQEYLNWRCRKPGADYEVIIAEKGKELNGYIVIEVRRETGEVKGHIVDLLAIDGADSVLIREALLRFISKKADFVLCWMLPHTAAYASLLEFVFIEKSDFPPLNVVYTIYDNEVIDDAFLKDQKNWYLTMADSDTF
jgi:hypothetical protein